MSPLPRAVALPSMKLPSLFVSHGAPDLALRETAWGAALREFAAGIPRPSAIVVVSAHWEAWGPVRVTSTKSPETIHDFAGFPAPLYEIEYPAPGEPALAARIVGRPSRRGDRRGIGLVARPRPRSVGAAPAPRAEGRRARRGGLPAAAADARVCLRRRPGARAAQGRRDARSSGAAGWSTTSVSSSGRSGTPPLRAGPWNSRAWVRARLARADRDTLLSYRARAPQADRAHPTTEHFDPLFFALGAADGDPVRSVFEGFEMGSLSLGCLAFGL